MGWIPFIWYILNIWKKTKMHLLTQNALKQQLTVVNNKKGVWLWHKSLLAYAFGYNGMVVVFLLTSTWMCLQHFGEGSARCPEIGPQIGYMTCWQQSQQGCMHTASLPPFCVDLYDFFFCQHLSGCHWWCNVSPSLSLPPLSLLRWNLMGKSGSSWEMSFRKRFSCCPTPLSHSFLPSHHVSPSL